MLTLKSCSGRSHSPTPAEAAARLAGPGRAEFVLRLYALVGDAGGTVWDCEPKYGYLHCGVDLQGGEHHALWPTLSELIDQANRSCEVCGSPGELATDLEWMRVLCENHHRMIRSGTDTADLLAQWWRRLHPDRPDLWSDPMR